MELIQHIRKYGNTQGMKKTIPLAAAFRPPFQDFFQVDSLNIVIGINGDGKTTLLMNMAQCLLERDESNVTGIEYSTNPDTMDSNIRWRTGPLPDLGVVFYTPLPYRREMLPLARMIDASPQYSRKATKPKIGIFRAVAAKLGIETELCGTISFSPSLITKLLFPILASDTCDTHQKKFKKLAITMQRARLQMQRYEALTNASEAEDRRHEQVKKEYHEAEQSLTPILISYFQKYCPEIAFHPLIALASFEKQARGVKDRQQLARSFLELMKLAKFSTSADINYTRRFAHLLIVTIQQTGALVSPVEIPPDAHSHTILINERLQKMAMAPDVAIALSWAHLPSGLLALVDQFSRLKVAATRLVSSGKKHLVILIDEGDAYLHLDWQRKYIQLLDDFLGEIKQDYKSRKKKEILIQVILASHSLVLAGDVPNAMITNLSGEIKGIRTFAAPLDQLAFRSFKSYSIGEFAVKKINLLHNKIREGTIDADDKALINEIGDEGVRNALIRAMDEANKSAGRLT